MDMKELYTSPEVKLINFEAQENLTAEKTIELTSGVVIYDTGDISVELPLA